MPPTAPKPQGCDVASPASRPPAQPSERPTRVLRALIVEDCVDDAELVVLALDRAGLSLEHERIDSEAAFREAVRHPLAWDVILCDYDVPGFGAPRALEVMSELGLDLPFIVMSGHVDEEHAVTVLRRGAHDFVAKNRLTRLAPAINREVHEAQRRGETERELEATRLALIHGEKLRTLGQMAAGIAHDLKNILNPLSLQVQVLQRGNVTAEQLGPIADGMSRSLKRGADLFKRLHQFSRQGPETVGSCQLCVEVEQALDLLAETTRRVRGLHIERNLQDVGAVRAPPSEVVSATVNLVTNALEALEGSAQPRVWVTVAPSEGGVVLEVHDNGPGMSTEVQARIFEPFFTTKDQGTGLGLAGIYALMRRCEGRVEVHSAEGRGTTVALWFPLQVCLPLAASAQTGVR